MSVDSFIIFNLRETYHELGTYEVKIVLNPKLFKNGHTAEVSIVDSDGRPMKCDVKKWGRKIVCFFTIDKDVPDGVAAIKLKLMNSKEKMIERALTFWIIK